jgi:AcrR family transcriptional regulator
MTPIAQGNASEDKIKRILDAALEVFTEFSFEDATTGEIAGRSRMSKRDLYALFPTKQAILMGVVMREMQTQERSFRETIASTAKLRSLRSKLDLVGSALVEDVLSPSMGVVRRLVILESLRQPFLGNLFFEGGVAQRCKHLKDVLASHQKKNMPTKPADLESAAEHYFSMVAFFPSVMAEIGMRGKWIEPAIKKHVSLATEHFLSAHPSFE